MLADFVMTLAPGRSRQLGKLENGAVSVIAIATSIFFILLAFGVYVQSQIALNWFIGGLQDGKFHSVGTGQA